MKVEKYLEMSYNERFSFLCNLCEKARKEQQRKKLGSFYKV